MLLLANEEISNLFEQYVLYDVMYDLLDRKKKKNVKRYWPILLNTL